MSAPTRVEDEDQFMGKASNLDGPDRSLNCDGLGEHGSEGALAYLRDVSKVRLLGRQQPPDQVRGDVHLGGRHAVRTHPATLAN
jgi:hypothetical protein